MRAANTLLAANASIRRLAIPAVPAVAAARFQASGPALPVSPAGDIVPPQPLQECLPQEAIQTCEAPLSWAQPGPSWDVSPQEGESLEDYKARAPRVIADAALEELYYAAQPTQAIEPGSMGFPTDLHTERDREAATVQRIYQERRSDPSFKDAAARVGIDVDEVDKIDPSDLSRILIEEWAYPIYGDAAVGDQAPKSGDPRGNADLDAVFLYTPFALSAGIASGLVIGAHTMADDAALWTIDVRSTSIPGGPLRQLGVRFWTP